MIPFIHDHMTHCTRCKDPFYYDATVCVAAPRVCDQCKLSRRAATTDAREMKRVQAQRERGERRKEQARTLGYSSGAMGDSLTKLTIRTHGEVAAILGITPEASRLAERSALSKLRKLLNVHLLERNIDNSLRTHE